MRQKPGTTKASADRVVKDIRRKTRKRHSPEEKIRIVLEGLRGEDSFPLVVPEQLDQRRQLGQLIVNFL